MFSLFLLFVFVQSCASAIYSLNDSDYARMPPLFHLDNYEECFDEPDSIYCFSKLALVSDEPSELLTMIQEISKSARHYNHSIINHGYCMKKSCNKFYNVSGTDLDLKAFLEACTNETIYDKYKLKTKVLDDFDCSKRDTDLPIDELHISIAVIFGSILMANVIGSISDYFLEKKTELGVLKYLYCFSIFWNWKKFTAYPGEGRDSRLKALAGIHGIRSLTIIFVFTSHSFYASIVMNVNPRIVEDWFEVKLYHIALNGAIIMQTFFVISSFLLVYNWLIHSEKHEISWAMLPKQIIIRWLRLTPSYAVVLGLTITWMATLSSGPYWKEIIYSEVTDCRINWWKHILYINNYYEDSKCMLQTWYLAADTQLYILGVIVFLICRTAFTRKVVLSLLFVLGLIAPTLHTYYQKLNGILVVTPQLAMNLFFGDPTFNQVYIKSHTNLAALAVGMATGYIIYYWQKAGGDPKRFQKYRYLYWSIFFVGVLLHFSGTVFWLDGPPQPTYVHLLYAALLKPAYDISLAIVLAGIIIQFEGLFRRILEWRPFTFLGRLSFSAYLLHAAVVRNQVASIVYIQRTSLIGTAIKTCTLITGIFVLSFFFWMLVETPLSNLVGAFFRKSETQAVETKEVTMDTKRAENGNGIHMSPTKSEDGTVVIKMGSGTNSNALNTTKYTPKDFEGNS